MAGGNATFFSWNPQNLEIRTRSVERTLEPLVIQVTTLVNHKPPTGRQKGRSKRARFLMLSVKQAVELFIKTGVEIARENPEMRGELETAIEDVRTTGQEMYDSSNVFAHDPCNPGKREVMVGASRALLSAVTRLLILADMVDVYQLLRSVKMVEDNVEAIRTSSNQQDLMQKWNEFGENVEGLIDLAGMRQMDLLDPRRRDEIAAARAQLKKKNTMLLTASKAYVRHPELAAARANRDYAIKSVCDAVDMIHGATQGAGEARTWFYEAPGELSAALNEFDNNILMDPYTYNEVQIRPYLEDRLERIISGATLLADSPCTRPERQEAIMQQCTECREGLQNLLREYAANAGREPTDSLKLAMERMLEETRTLRKHLFTAVVDHVSDTFLETGTPLRMLVDAARAGDEAQVNALAHIFEENTGKLVEVANLACSMSKREEGTKFVRMAANQVEQLCPQVINAAHVLAARPQSKIAQDNMEVFGEAFAWSVRMLTDAVDDIIDVCDFLYVSEGHVLEDVQRCIQALHDGDGGEGVDRTAGVIRGRTGRVCDVVTAEMADYRSNSDYVDRVMETVVVLRDQIVPTFSRHVSDAVYQLGSVEPGQQAHGVNEAAFANAARKVYEGVRDIRRAVWDRDQPGYDSDYPDNEEEEEKGVSGSQENVVEEKETRNERSIMRLLPPQEREALAQEISGFLEEKKKFMREMTKWDDSANDIVVLSKRMCMITMEMTDFTRGKGPLKSTMDVIQAARRISECGSQLDRLARAIADQCPDSESKKDLLAYLQRITLYCHQLNITSKVKADVQNVGGELVVSGLDSATSLIQAAKNLMTGVVSTVKASYLASTKYKGADQRPVVQWRMKAPSKKPLIQRERYEGHDPQIRRSARVKQVEPIRELSQFDQPTGNPLS